MLSGSSCGQHDDLAQVTAEDVTEIIYPCRGDLDVHAETLVACLIKRGRRMPPGKRHT
jgi:hypothetical protein